MGSVDVDSTLLCSSGMKRCHPMIFRVLYAELPCQTLQLHNMNCIYFIRFSLNIYGY